MNSASPNTRWIQLLLGLVCMIVISSPQYVWALFTQPLTTGLGASLPELQITFSILIVVQTFLSPWQGVLVDRFGPRLLLSIGVLVTGLSWILAAQASSLTTLYLTYGLLGGIGTGIVYVGVIGHMVQWFPDKRGLATGLVAAGYGVGALLTTFPIATVLRESTYEDALTRFGLIFAHSGSRRGARVAAAGRRVADGVESARAGGARVSTTSIDLSPIQMLGTRIFWLMFVMMTMMSTTGLMVTSQMGAFTRDFGMASVLVWGLPLLPLALSLDRITNGATRPFFGWVSDRYGRENTMLIAFALEGTAMTLWLLSREHARAVRVAVGARVLRVGRNLLALPVNVDRYVRDQARDGQLRVPVHGAGSRLGAGWPGGCASSRLDRLVDPRLRGHHRDGLHDCCACDWGAQANAAALAGGRSHYLSRRDRSPGRRQRP